MKTTRRSNKHGPGERGVALLTALLATSLLTVVVMQFTFKTQVEARRTAQWVNAKRAELLAESGILLAAQLLEFDHFADQLQTPPIDHLEEPWAEPLGPIDDGSGGDMTIWVQDDSGRYDLNRLRSPSLDERARAESVFRSAGVDTALIGPLIDWLDDNSETFPVPEGAEDDYYLGLPRGHTARNNRLRTFSELALLRGFKPIDLVRLRSLATVTPDNTKLINVNTAPKEVLRAIVPRLEDPLLLNRFVERRDAAPFQSVKEILEIEGMDGLREPDLDKLLTVKSLYFRVRATGGADGAYRSVEAQLHRAGGRIQLVYWARRRGPNIPAVDVSVRGNLDDFSTYAQGDGLGRR